MLSSFPSKAINTIFPQFHPLSAHVATTHEYSTLSWEAIAVYWTSGLQWSDWTGLDLSSFAIANSTVV